MNPMYSKRSRSCPKSNTHTLSLQYYEPTKGSRRLKNVGRGCSYIELRRPVSSSFQGIFQEVLSTWACTWTKHAWYAKQTPRVRQDAHLFIYFSWNARMISVFWNFMGQAVTLHCCHTRLDGDEWKNTCSSKSTQTGIRLFAFYSLLVCDELLWHARCLNYI